MDYNSETTNFPPLESQCRKCAGKGYLTNNDEPVSYMKVSYKDGDRACPLCDRHGKRLTPFGKAVLELIADRFTGIGESSLSYRNDPYDWDAPTPSKQP